MAPYFDTGCYFMWFWSNRPIKSCVCILEDRISGKVRTVQVRRSIEVPVGCLRVSQRAGLEFIAVDEFIFILERFPWDADW